MCGDSPCLRRDVYKRQHFTHADAPWERTDMTEVLECACRAKDMGVSDR